MTACDDTDPGPTRTTTSTTIMSIPSSVVTIHSVYPSAGAPGSTVAIFVEIFDPAISYSYVTFDSSSGEITHVGNGAVHVLVPENLAAGDYTISLHAGGRVISAPGKFTVTDSPY